MDLTYEEAIQELEKILKELEDNNCTLEQTVEKFKKGIKLYNYCNELLYKVEGEVKVLLENDNGEVLETPFPMEG